MGSIEEIDVKDTYVTGEKGLRNILLITFT